MDVLNGSAHHPVVGRGPARPPKQKCYPCCGLDPRQGRLGLGPSGPGLGLGRQWSKLTLHMSSPHKRLDLKGSNLYSNFAL